MYRTLIALALLGLASIALAKTENLPLAPAQNLTRACFQKIGDSVVAFSATTSADGDSGALNKGSSYKLYCTADFYVRFGASAVTADSGDMIYPGGVLHDLPTGGPEGFAHVSVLGKDVSVTCRMLECF